MGEVKEKENTEHDEGNNNSTKTLYTKKITLPTRETFVATYDRPSRPNLPRNVIVRRKRQIGPRTQQKRRAQLHRNVTVRRTRHA